MSVGPHDGIGALRRRDVRKLPLSLPPTSLPSFCHERTQTRRWSSANQEEGLHQTPTMPAPRSLTSSLQDCEK